MKLEDLVSKHYEELNENDLLIWNYIAKHKKACESMSIDELGNRCHVSRSTVLRFAKRLGLKGYAELKVYLRIDNHMGETKALNDEIHATYLKTIERYHRYRYDEIIASIDNASNVVVYATGVIQGNAAKHLRMLFSEEKKILLYMEAMDYFETFLQLLGKDDVFIAVSFGGENPRLCAFIQRLKAKGVIVIGVSAFEASTLACLAHHHLTIDNMRLMTSDGHFTNMITSYFVLFDYLFVQYVDYKKRGMKHASR